MSTDEWVECFDETHQCPYYYNTLTGVSQWEDPHQSTVSEPYELDDSQVNQHNEQYSDAESDDNYVEESNKPQMPAHLLMTEEPLDYSCRDSSPPTSSSIPTDAMNSVFYYSDMDDEDDGTEEEDTGLYNYKVTYIPYEEERVVMEASRVDLDQTYSDREDPISKLNQDYLHLARTYKLHRPYMDAKAQLLCVLCHRENCVDVLFPCEHRCICRTCIRKENVREQHLITDEQLERGEGFCNCPLCGSIIKRMLGARGGLEREEYWQWATEIVPTLPLGFMRNFKHSEAVIRAVYLEGLDEEEALQRSKGQCAVS